MAIIPDSLRPFRLWFLIIVAAVVIIGVAHLLFPPWLQPIKWLVTLAVTAATPLLLREFLPENARDRIRYHSNRFKKRWWENPDIHVSIAVRYSLTDSAELSELSREVQSDLGTAPAGESRFEINEETGFGTIQKVVNLDIDRSGVGQGSSMHEELQQESQQVGNIRIEFTADTKYNDLKNMLIDLFEEESDIRSIFSPYGIQTGGYEIVCELDEPILLRKFMSKFDMESIQATTEEGTDIEFREREIRLRNPNGGQLSATFDKTIEIVTYYG